jgi:uncharacterized protein YbjT (DUF2867 family)
MPHDHRPVLVTGGTGTLGRAVVLALVDTGHLVRVLSRRPRTPDDATDVEWAVADLVANEGVDTACAGVRAVVHCASEPRGGDNDLHAVDALLRAARTASVEHLVHVSIVGVDVVPWPYYDVKRRVEDRIAAADVPWTVLRATQFHDFLVTLLDRRTRGRVTFAPRRMRNQPVAVPEVARRLVELVDLGPSGRVPDLAGPQVLSAPRAARLLARARGGLRLVVPVPFAAAPPFDGSGHLSPAHGDGRTTFAQHLATTPRAADG